MDVTFENRHATWDVLAKLLEAFIGAWESGDCPSIAAHLPTGPPVLRKLALVEFVKADLDYRHQAKTPRLLEEYIREFPDLAESDGPACDLIYEEFHVRRRHGYDVTIDEYFARFPARQQELKRLLGSVDTAHTTSLFNEARPITLKEGDRIDDFDLLARLGQGAFGAVFLARQRSISRLVALKVSADRGQEARTLAQLDHPNIVRVFDQRRMPEQKLRLVYMQFASGGTLADVVARIRGVPATDRSGRHLVEVLEEASEKNGLGPMVDPATLRGWAQLSWPEVVCRLGAQLAHALDYAHRQGVLHRDVKPANILLGGDGTPKLADFNISSLASNPAVSAAAYFGGSLAYMSPEHLEAFNPHCARQAEELDGRADLYSLAVVLWELLCGQKPFQDTRLANDMNGTMDEMARRRREKEFQAATAPPGQLSRDLLEVLERCLSPNPADRPLTGSELARELTLCVQPQSQRIVRLPRRGWREWVRRFPVLAVLVVVTIPNALAGGFNYQYNKAEIVAKLPGAENAYPMVPNIINGVAFPLGAFLVWLFVRPIASALAALRRNPRQTPPNLAVLRTHALRLGHWAAVIGIVEWLISGLIYPVALHAYAGQMPASVYPHFFISLALCGLVGGAYPFFGVTCLAVRVFLPALLPRGTIDPLAELQLRRLGQQAGFYLLIALGAPIVGLLLLIVFGSQYKEALLTLTILSLMGLAVAFTTYGIILRDIAALIPVIRAADPFGTESTSVITKTR